MAIAYGSLAQVMGGPQGLLQYLMLQDNTYEKLAQANAQAIQGLQPKITVWNTSKDSQLTMPLGRVTNVFVYYSKVLKAAMMVQLTHARRFGTSFSLFLLYSLPSMTRLGSLHLRGWPTCRMLHQPRWTQPKLL